MRVDRRISEASEGDERGCGCERVSRERPGLVDGANGRQFGHDVGPATEGSERQAAADDLPEHGQVGRDAKQLLGASARQPKARDHFVEDEQRSGAVAGLAKRFEEPFSGRDDPHVRGNRLDEDARELVSMALDGSGDRVEVVEGADDRVFGGSGGYARAGRDPEGRKPRARAREERVRVAVVTAGELQDAVASGEPASKPDGAHRGLRPGGDQPHELDGGNRVHDLLGELDFSLRRGAERRAFAAAAWTAATTSGSAWPKTSGPQDMTQSR